MLWKMVFHDACGRFWPVFRHPLSFRDQILALSFSRSKRQYWTVGNRPIRNYDLRSLRRNSAEAQIQDRSRQKTGLNTVPGFSRVYTPSQQTSPSRSEGDACAARRGCPKFTTPVIPASPSVIPADYPVIPADAGTQSKTKHAFFLPFAERRGRVRSTQGMHEIHHPRPIPRAGTTQGNQRSTL